MIPIRPLSDILGAPQENFGRYYGNYLFQTHQFDGGGIFSPRRLQRKAWIFSGIVSPEYITGFAIVDAGIVATAFCYVSERSTGMYREEKTTIPYGFPDNFQPSLSEQWQIKDGKKFWKFSSNKSEYRFEYLGDEFSLQYVCNDNPNGVSTIAPSKDRPFHFTYKNMNLDFSGVLSLGNLDIPIKGDSCVLDFSKGYPPRETKWNWACLVGTTGSGEIIGINLVSHFNEGLENTYWLSGIPGPLDPAVFTYTKPISDNTTKIHTTCGTLEIDFFPEGRRSETLNAILLKSEFIQAFGSFRGTLLQNGKKISLSGRGLAEDHYALW